MAAQDEGVFEAKGFAGLRNNVEPWEFEAGDLLRAENVDLSDSGRVRRRAGFIATPLGAPARALYSSGDVCLAVLNETTLVRVMPDYSVVTIRSDLTPRLEMGYTSPIPGVVLYSNGRQRGCVDAGAHANWGIDPPSFIGVASVVGGSMIPGDYTWTVTFVRDDGQESGALLFGRFTLDQPGGVSIVGLPVSSDPQVVARRIYVSTSGGEVLYAHATVPSGGVATTIVANAPATVPLQTAFLSVPPPAAGAILATYRGRVLVAVADRLIFTEPYSWALFDLRKGFRFGSPITIVAPVVDGVYLGTRDGVFWLPGEQPESWTLVDKAPYGAIPGTLAYAPAERFSPDREGAGDGVSAVFATTEGICVGDDGGRFRNMTQGRFAYPIQDRGAMTVRTIRGTSQALLTMQGTEIRPPSAV